MTAPTPGPGVWTGEGNPTRRDCVRLAVECANGASDWSLPPAANLAWADAAKAWAAIAAVAEATQSPDEDDIKRCGHDQIVWRSPTGTWVHPNAVARCDSPPSE